MGDHGRDDAMELRETLRWYGELPEGNGVVCCALSKRRGETTEGLRGRFSSSTLVEEFHRCFPGVMVLAFIVVTAS